MTVNRCHICKVAWEEGQPAKHLMTCTIHDFLFFPSSHRKPTEMESRVMAAMAGWGIGDDRFEVARAVIREMREPTTEMLRKSGMVVAGNTEAHAAVWETMIDAASPRDEQVIASLPIHKYVWIDSSFIRTNGKGFEPAVWFGLVSQYGRVWGLNVLLECGAIYRSLPPHAVAFCKDPDPWTIIESQLWDCYADKFQLHEYAYLRAMRVKTRNNYGDYLFTAAFTDDGFTRAPEQQKEFSFIELDNGRLTIQPTNRTLFEDRSFTINTGTPADIVTQTEVWSCE